MSSKIRSKHVDKNSEDMRKIEENIKNKKIYVRPEEKGFIDGVAKTSFAGKDGILKEVRFQERIDID